MRARTQPKMWCKHPIYNPDNRLEEIGQIAMVSYLCKGSIPHLEFFISDKFEHLRGRGIMSKELPKYLKFCKKYGHYKLIAVVKKDNIASQKLLETNSFLKISEIENKLCYMIDLSLPKQVIEGMVLLIDKMFPKSKGI